MRKVQLLFRQKSYRPQILFRTKTYTSEIFKKIALLSFLGILIELIQDSNLFDHYLEFLSENSIS